MMLTNYWQIIPFHLILILHLFVRYVPLYGADLSIDQLRSAFLRSVSCLYYGQKSSISQTG